MTLPAQQPSTAYQVLDITLKTIATASLLGIVVVLALILPKLDKVQDDLHRRLPGLSYIDEISEGISGILRVLNSRSS